MFTYEEVNSILKTLPISYYLGRKLDVELSKDSTSSYFEIMNDKIVLSYDMIVEAITRANGTTLENDVRNLLYHEVSHAMLTPTNLRSDTIFNIFEDERIETICKDTYMGVDFKEFVVRMNDFKGDAPKNALDMFYQVVRYRRGPKQFTDTVVNIINDHAMLTRYTGDADKVYWYMNDIRSLYKAIEEYFANTDDATRQADTQQDEQKQIDSLTMTIAENDDDNAEETEHIDIGRLIMQQSISSFDDDAITSDLDEILASIKSTAKHNSSAINSYSGVFDPRSVVRQDYKWFVQKARLGHVRMFSKLKLNLFIDCSSSFEYNDATVNKLLKALHRFEKANTNFSFDLISCSCGQRIRKKNDRIQCSRGGTCIDSEIFTQYAQVQQADAQNINVILYDGDCACSGDYRNAANLKCFDNSHCILIMDNTNERYTRKYCKTAKVIISQDYTQELYKNVVNAIRLLAKI